MGTIDQKSLTPVLYEWPHGLCWAVSSHGSANKAFYVLDGSLGARPCSHSRASSNFMTVRAGRFFYKKRRCLLVRLFRHKSVPEYRNGGRKKDEPFVNRQLLGNGTLTGPLVFETSRGTKVLSFAGPKSNLGAGIFEFDVWEKDLMSQQP